jgi:hypothetical protein
MEALALPGGALIVSANATELSSISELPLIPN